MLFFFKKSQEDNSFFEMFFFLNYDTIKKQYTCKIKIICMLFGNNYSEYLQETNENNVQTVYLYSKMYDIRIV